MADLLIEIQTEELPANYLAYGDLNGQKLFRDAFQKGFDQINAAQAYQYDGLKIYLTPRRLLFICESIVADETEREEILYGPPADRAYDATGKPTKVLEGFMNSKGASLKDIEIAEYKGRSCISSKRRIKPEPFLQQIQMLLDEMIRALNFPKFMWWDDSGFKFPRPVRGLLCLFLDQSVSIHIGKIASSETTMVFRNGNRKTIQINSSSDYVEKMRMENVILDQDERKKTVQSAIDVLAKSVGSRASNQEALLEEVVFLTEAPVCLLGKYADLFSDLPKQVLTSSLSKSQRLFELLQKDNEVHMPYFIMVLDGAVSNNEVVLKNVASILTAKLQDSHFFFSEDSQLYADSKRLEALRNDLNNLVYLKGVGSVGEKSSRLERVVQQFQNEGLFAELDLQSVAVGARYAKVDLLTQIVGEFPELQGIIGGIYLSKKSGYSDLIGKIVAEHYQPLSANSKVPSQKEAALLSLLDKADLVVACFAIGKKPSASQDPYGLKRNMSAIYKICEAHHFDESINDVLFSICKQICSSFAELTPVDVLFTELKSFHKERLQNYFENQFPHYGREMITAVLEVESDRIWSVDTRLHELNQMRSSEEFLLAAQIVERTTNILKNIDTATLPPIQESLLTEPSEQKLFSTLHENQEQIISLIKKDEYQKATRLYAKAFNAILNQFFDQVLVNVDDLDTRLNRLSLLMQIRNLYASRVADLSKIKTDRLFADPTS